MKTNKVLPANGGPCDGWIGPIALYVTGSAKCNQICNQSIQASKSQGGIVAASTVVVLWVKPAFMVFSVVVYLVQCQRLHL